LEAAAMPMELTAFVSQPLSIPNPACCSSGPTDPDPDEPKPKELS
jgi:hypothetical protein